MQGLITECGQWFLLILKTVHLKQYSVNISIFWNTVKNSLALREGNEAYEALRFQQQKIFARYKLSSKLNI